MIISRSQSGRLLAINPSVVCHFYDNSDLSLDGKGLTAVRTFGSIEPIKLCCEFMDFIKAINECESTGKSVSLVEGVELK